MEFAQTKLDDLMERNAGNLLLSIELQAWPERLDSAFPFTVPALRSLHRLELNSAVTFLVGENGSGKSSFLEGLACAIGAVTVGAETVQRDPTLEPMRQFSQYLRLVWKKRTHKGFFLRAEDFFGYARRMERIKGELRQDLENVDIEYKGRSAYTIGYAKMAYQNELGAIEQRYGSGLDSRSHGENFLLLFQERFIPGGLYLLDEPEAPLSPLRQLSFLALLSRMVGEQAQFLIATHSPILMAFPGAQILNFENGMIQPAKYEDLEHVRLTRDFLNNPAAYLRRLEEQNGDED
jgi:predicted ATPase